MTAGFPTYNNYQQQFETQKISRPIRYPQKQIVNKNDYILKEAKKQKRKDTSKNVLNWSMAIAGLGASAAIIYSVFGKGRGSSEILKAINECKIPELKRAAMSEFNKGHSASMKKIKDILTLSKISNKEAGWVDIPAVMRKMDEKIVDMPEVKESVLDFLIEYNVNLSKGIKNKKPFVLAIDGPAGTGKTTVSEVIAEAIGIPYKKISMGGATGKSVIRGTESHYVSAEAGNIARGQIDNRSNRVLYLLDEVDKVGKSEQHGSVESTLLSLFDDQARFADDFLGTEIDVSQSMFVLTTNDFNKLSTPLKNRVRLININPYGHETKAKIAKLDLTNKLKENKLHDLVEINDNAYMQIAKLTSDEGGRETTRNVDNIIRQINTMIGLGEMPKGKLEINSEFIRRHLVPEEKTKTLRQRITEAVKEGRMPRKNPITV